MTIAYSATTFDGQSVKVEYNVVSCPLIDDIVYTPLQLEYLTLKSSCTLCNKEFFRQDPQEYNGRAVCLLEVEPLMCRYN